MNSEINNNLALSPMTPVKTDTGSQSSASSTSNNSSTPTTNAGPVNLSPVSTNKPPSLSAIKNAAAQSNPLLQASNLSVEYSVDSSSKEVVIKVVDSGNGKLIRQIPSAEMLDFVKRLQDMEAQQKGAVIQTRA
jgi:flagellar protein FlaG